MSAGPAAEDHLYLIGRTPFKQYLDFMTTEPVDARTADRKQIADDWRAAHDYLRHLEGFEATWADNPALLPLPQTLQPLVARVLADPVYQRAFAAVPVAVSLVELDRLTVRQKLINLAHVQRLKEQVGPTPDPEQVFRLCLPFDHPTVRPRMAAVASDTFVFLSESNDLRVLESLVLRPDQLANYPAEGPLGGVAGVVVGYGSNYVNVIAVEGRLVLNNGSHRAYALRSLGLTEIPCVIQKVTNREELDVVAAGALRRSPDLYLKEPRPPVLKDYFDVNLRKVVRLVPTVRCVRVRFTVETFDLPDK